MILENEYVVQIFHILQQNLVVYLMVYLVVFEKDYFFGLFTLFTNVICILFAPFAGVLCGVCVTVSDGINFLLQRAFCLQMLSIYVMF